MSQESPTKTNKDATRTRQNTKRPLVTRRLNWKCWIVDELDVKPLTPTDNGFIRWREQDESVPQPEPVKDRKM